MELATIECDREWVVLAECDKRPPDITQWKLRNFTWIFKETFVASKKFFIKNYFEFRTKDPHSDPGLRHERSNPGKSFRWIPNQSDSFRNLYPSQSEFIRVNSKKVFNLVWCKSVENLSNLIRDFESGPNFKS